MFQDSDFKEVGREDFIFLHRCQKVVQQFRLVGKVMVMKEGNS